MRTEIKIGIAVGLVMAVVAVLYLVFAGPSATMAPKPKQSPQSPSAEMPVNLVERAEPNRPAAAPETLVPRIGVTTETPSVPAVVEVPAPPAPAVSKAVVPTLSPGPAAATTRPAVTPQPAKVEPIARRETSDSIVPTVPATATEGSYVVQKGDSGFWSIAEKVYGQGKHWRLISKANPNVDSNNLAVGQKLVIPPLPTASAAPKSTVSTFAPAVESASADQKVHIVQQGDSWWSIANKEYGDGRYWYEIKKANPHVEGSSLQVGMKLKIPAINKAAKPTPPATAPAERTKPKEEAPRENGDVRPVFD